LCELLGAPTATMSEDIVLDREDGIQIVRYQKHHLQEAILLYSKIWAEQNIIVKCLHISQQELLPYLTKLCKEFLEVDFN